MASSRAFARVPTSRLRPRGERLLVSPISFPLTFPRRIKPADRAVCGGFCPVSKTVGGRLVPRGFESHPSAELKSGLLSPDARRPTETERNRFPSPTCKSAWVSAGQSEVDESPVRAFVPPTFPRLRPSASMSALSAHRTGRGCLVRIRCSRSTGGGGRCYPDAPVAIRQGPNAPCARAHWSGWFARRRPDRSS
jgi:hypothetical protein